MHDVLDIWDPNNWPALFAQREPFRVYGHANLGIWAEVDYVDYIWATRWCWCVKRDPNGAAYLRRAVGENVNGQRLRTYTVYLHVAIMKRTHKRRPTRNHFLVDHRDGNTLNCRRENLRWATPSMNSRNRWAQRPRDLIEDAV